jgi:hypothetical protein
MSLGGGGSTCCRTFASAGASSYPVSTCGHDETVSVCRKRNLKYILLYIYTRVQLINAFRAQQTGGKTSAAQVLLNALVGPIVK